METKNLDEEIKRLLDRWNESILDKDAAAAAELREEAYTATLPDGGVLTKEEEVALIASPSQTVESIRLRNLQARPEGGGVTAAFENLIEGEFLGERIKALYKYTITFGENDGVWRARSSTLALAEAAALSLPFNFATTTRVPHLPFEDRSFRLIYCGSVFTHIDDLADAWLLELQRTLSPGGRLYLTIHDNHTVELFESGRYDSAEIVRRIKSRETYRQAKDSFGMFTVGRGINSQVFYDADYFSKTLRPMFDILSVTREAYFYQTAFLLKRK